MKRLFISLWLACSVIGASVTAWAEPGQMAGGDVGPVPAASGMVVRNGVLLSQAQEQRAEEIGDKLRCLVCQNESVEISQATLAQQFRGIIRRQIVRGESSGQIIDYMVQRYGIFILLKPPLVPATWLLWFSPFIALLCGGLVLLFARRRREPPPPLSSSEEARLKDLMPR